MMGCVRSLWFSILLNGTSKDFFCASRGIRQGDPLLPFLFSLVTDCVSSLLSHAIQVNLIEGFKIPFSVLTISHLQFADDTIIFIRPTLAATTNLKHIFQIFELISGLN